MAERNSSSSRTTASERGGIGSASTGRTAGMSSTGQNAPGRARETESASQGIADKVRERASAQLNTQKDRATEGLGTMAQAVRQSTQQLRDQHHETVAGYVEQAADQIDRLSQGLKNRDVGQLVQDAQRLASRRPALFVGSAFAVGFASARFLKSSPPEGDRSYERDWRGSSETRGYVSQGSGGYATAGGDPGHALPSSTASTAGRTSSSSSTYSDKPGTER
jgi:hypothetical protein